MNKRSNPFDIKTSPEYWSLYQRLMTQYPAITADDNVLEPYNVQGYLTVSGVPNNSNKFKSDILDSGYAFIGIVGISVNHNLGSANTMVGTIQGIGDDNTISFYIPKNEGASDTAEFVDPFYFFPNPIVCRNLTTFWNSFDIPIWYKTTGFRVKIS